MNTLNIKPGMVFTRKTLFETFGISDQYSFTRPYDDGPVFLFSGKNVEGNTHIEWVDNESFKLRTRFRCADDCADGLKVANTELGEWVNIIDKQSSGNRYMGVARLSRLRITGRQFDGVNDNWIISCTIRGNLVNDISYADIVPSAEEADPLETKVIEPTAEGNRIIRYTTRYERSPKNREAAIREHGTVCMACGFDFGKVYGKLGEGFIEVHHVKPLYDSNEETVPDPKTDLICLCSNCHSMIHHKKNRIMTLEELREILGRNR